MAKKSAATTVETLSYLPDKKTERQDDRMNRMDDGVDERSGPIL